MSRGPRIRRLLRTMLATLWKGCVYSGFYYGMASGAEYVAAIRASAPEGTGPRCGLPAGHPERMIPDVPPTGAEELLWRDLGPL
ncbi:hypothetical protein OIE66_26685 [Nonomuraea sp. NBC_01738]|uniref:DUF6059 family protein n=1 Tax=Nonomuraea sp. NBC_01738 TaxID=2976003 RepID=UPI002E127C55|nr:hypothetical protein OIE66_26685 [Nonomuraea sp. NBC_01738]